MARKLFRFLISTRVPSVSLSVGRMERLASNRMLPFSISPLETPSQRSSRRSSRL